MKNRCQSRNLIFDVRSDKKRTRSRNMNRERNLGKKME